MNYLFLDIDGVLNRDSTKELSSTGPEGPQGLRKWKGLDKYLVNKFLTWYNRQQNLSIVLSSTWRRDPIMTKEITLAGIPYVGITRVILNEGSRHVVRGEEVADYLRDNPSFEGYVILDDTPDFFHDQKLCFVQTSPIHGLRDKDLKKMERILNEQSDWTS